MRSVWALLALMTPGCFLSPIPDTRTAVDRARELEGKCRDADERPASAAPEGVEPDVVYVNGGPNGREARFRGARIRLAPSAGGSSETVERSLRCRQADVTLGRARPRDDDPYVLPGRWLSIDVESSGDGFLVHVRADRLEDARIVLDRAEAFARRGQSRPASAGAPASPPPGQPLPLQ